MSEISPMWPTGCSAPSCACVSIACIGVLMTPGATAFARIPRFAYSIASDLVAALRPPLVSEASTDGTPAIRMIDEARRDLHDMAASPFLHLGDGELGDAEEAGDVDAEDRGEVRLGVPGERLGDEDAGVVDERVDAPEPRHGFKDHAFGRLPIGDVAGDGKNLVVVRRLDRASRRDHAVIAIAIGPDERGADALRSARDHRNFLFGTHGELPLCWLTLPTGPPRRRSDT